MNQELGQVKEAFSRQELRISGQKECLPFPELICLCFCLYPAYLTGSDCQIQLFQSISWEPAESMSSISDSSHCSVVIFLLWLLQASVLH